MQSRAELIRREQRQRKNPPEGIETQFPSDPPAGCYG